MRRLATPVARLTARLQSFEWRWPGVKDPKHPAAGSTQPLWLRGSRALCQRGRVPLRWQRSRRRCASLSAHGRPPFSQFPSRHRVLGAHARPATRSTPDSSTENLKAALFFQQVAQDLLLSGIDCAVPAQAFCGTVDMADKLLPDPRRNCRGRVTNRCAPRKKWYARRHCGRAISCPTGRASRRALSTGNSVNWLTKG